MGKVIYNMSMSLDGFVRAAGYTQAPPLGRGGERLHEWFFSKDPINRRFSETMLDSIGAVVSGRTTYDSSAWGADGPTSARRLPVFVVTHKAPASSPENGVYTFVTGGVAEAIAAGLVDEIVVSVAPVLFGDGRPMFSGLPDHVRLERISVVGTATATHIAYRVLKCLAANEVLWAALSMNEASARGRAARR